jgi:CDP-diacylglycerol--serine O-phosphatidyltransferase
VLVIFFVVLFKEVAFLCVCLGYVFFGLVRHWRRSQNRLSAPPSNL